MKLAYALSFAAQLGFLIVAPLAGFIWLGVFLDRIYGASPTFLLTGLFLALVVTGHETYRMLKPLLSSDESVGPDEGPGQPQDNPMKPPEIPWVWPD